jgi:hypothetical protein
MNWEQLAQVLTPTVTGVTVSGIWAFFAQRGRQAFEQRQAADQRIAQQALEALKTELTLTAEVRRQVASRKVEAIFHIAAQTKTLVEQVYGLSSQKDIQTLNKPMSEYWNALRQALLVLGPETTAAVELFGREVGSAIGAWAKGLHGPGPGVDVIGLSDRGEAARDRLFDTLRCELGIEAHGKAEAK